MALQIGQLVETPGGPSASVHPLISFGHFERNVAAGATEIIPQGIGGIAATGNDWLPGTTQFLSGHIFAGNVNGGTLLISQSMDGVGVWDNYLPIWLAGGMVTYFGPIEISGWNIRLSIVNMNAGFAQLFQGTILLKAV